MLVIFIISTAVFYKNFQPWKNPEQHEKKKPLIFHVCVWYHQSAADMLLVFDAIFKLRLFVDIFRDCGC